MIPCFTRNKAEYNVFNCIDPESEMSGSIFIYQFKKYRTLSPGLDPVPRSFELLQDLGSNLGSGSDPRALVKPESVLCVIILQPLLLISILE